jgi:hypothetical protein
MVGLEKMGVHLYAEGRATVGLTGMVRASRAIGTVAVDEAVVRVRWNSSCGWVTYGWRTKVCPQATNISVMVS